uniref:BTB domain-containing protein n=1 Tax=Macrostomum lignano TaxID=282301 RepID=A0A1I8FVP9_9PLAT
FQLPMSGKVPSSSAEQQNAALPGHLRPGAGSSSLSVAAADLEDSVMFRDKRLFLVAFPSFERIRRQGKLCDVTLRVAGSKFSAHRVVLAASIPFFYGMFMHDMKECAKGEVEMQGIEANALELLINFAYTGEVQITCENVQELFSGASYLQVPEVKDACVDFMRARLSVSNVAEVCRFAQQFDCQPLVAECQAYMTEHFTQLAATEEFKALSLDELTGLLIRDEVHVGSEEEPPLAATNLVKTASYFASLKIAAALMANRGPYQKISQLDRERIVRAYRSGDDRGELGRMMGMKKPTVRNIVTTYERTGRVGTLPKGGVKRMALTEAMVDTIVQFVEGQPTASHASQVPALDQPFPDVLQSVYQAGLRWLCHRQPERQSAALAVLRCIRLTQLPTGLLADISKDPVFRNSLECRDLLDDAKAYFLLPERRFGQLSSMRTQPRSCLSACGCIYAVGGLTSSGDSISTVECYDPGQKQWRVAENMTTHRSRVGVAVLNGRLYAIGGYDGKDRLNTVELFDPGAGQWRRVAPMNCKRSALGAAALIGKLYVCGGYDGVSSLRSCEVYWPERDQWHMMPNMADCRSAGGVVALDNQLYALGGHNGLAIYDTVERLSPWTLAASLNALRSRVALTATWGKLYAIGGYNGVQNLSSVEVYDEESKVWAEAPPLTAHEGGVGVGVLPPRCGLAVSYSAPMLALARGSPVSAAATAPGSPAAGNSANSSANLETMAAL